MNTRLFVCVYGTVAATALGLMTSAGLLLAEQDPTDAPQKTDGKSSAAPAQFNARNTAESAVQRELNAMFGKPTKQAQPPAKNAAPKNAAAQSSLSRHHRRQPAIQPVAARSNSATAAQDPKQKNPIEQLSGWFEKRSAQPKKLPANSTTSAAATGRQKQTQPIRNPIADLFQKKSSPASQRPAKPAGARVGDEAKQRPTINPLSELLSKRPTFNRNRTVAAPRTNAQQRKPSQTANPLSGLFRTKPTPVAKPRPAPAQMRPPAADHASKPIPKTSPTDRLGNLGNLFPEMSETNADRVSRPKVAIAADSVAPPANRSPSETWKSRIQERPAPAQQQALAQERPSKQGKPQTTVQRPQETQPAAAELTQKASPKPNATPGGPSVLQQLQQLSARQAQNSLPNAPTSSAQPKTTDADSKIQASKDRPKTDRSANEPLPQTAGHKPNTKTPADKPIFNLFSNSRKPKKLSSRPKMAAPAARNTPRVAQADGNDSSSNDRRTPSLLERVLPIQNVLPFGKKPATSEESKTTAQPQKQVAPSNIHNDRVRSGHRLAQRTHPSGTEPKAKAVAVPTPQSKSDDESDARSTNPMLNIPRLLPDFLSQPRWPVSNAKPDEKPAKPQQPIAEAQPTLAPRRAPNAAPSLQERIQSIVRPQPKLAAQAARQPLPPTPVHFEPMPDPISTPIAEPVAQPAAEPPKEPISAKPTDNRLSDMGNLFPEMSESDADQTTNVGPFTGLTLSEPLPVAAKKTNRTSPAQRPTAGQTQPGPDAAQTARRSPQTQPSPRAKTTPDVAPSTKEGQESKTPAPVAAARPPAISANQRPQRSDSTKADLPKVSPVSNRADASEKLPEVRSRDPHRQKQARISERVGLTGFKGFCPVVLRERRELSDSDPQFASSFEGQTYYFSTVEAKAKFDEAPKMYAPVAGGNDVVLLSNSGEAVEGKLDFAVWYHDRLYLFHSRETLQKFVLQPTQHKIEQTKPLDP